MNTYKFLCFVALASSINLIGMDEIKDQPTSRRTAARSGSIPVAIQNKLAVAACDVGI